jgi:hypothetical protein
MPTQEDFQALREVEVAWLAGELSRAIENLAYPVGMGVAPMHYHVEAAAKMLFERYAKMIEMAHTTAHSSARRGAS